MGERVNTQIQVLDFFMAEYKTKNHSGNKYNMLLVLSKCSYKSDGCYVYKMLCDCGNIIHKPLRYIKIGRVKSCGCLSQTTRFKKGQNLSGKRIYPDGTNYAQRYRDDLRDTYIHALLSRGGIKNPTQETVEQKRLLLKIKRKIKQIQNEKPK
jgi:hypothetical protein